MSQEEVPRLNLLSFALGTEFNECSIAAAELNKSVSAELDTSVTRPRFLYPIDTDPMLGRNFVTKQLNCICKAGEDKYRLALARPTPPPGRNGVIKRLVAEIVEVAGNEPQLLAILGNEDAFIPLATFARREGGSCSYVQVGSEMRDDNLFVTTADEGGSRQGIIESIRKTIDVTGKERIEMPVLDSLLTEELAGKEQLLDRAKEVMLVRRALEHVKKTPSRVKLKVFDAEVDNFRPQDINTNVLFTDLTTTNKRSISLVLGHANNSLQLLAVTRGDIALPLAGFDHSTGKVDLFELEKQVSAEERRSIISTLHYIIVQTFSPPKFDYRHDWNRDKVQLAIARDLKDRGLLKLWENTVPRYARTKIKGAEQKKVHAKIDKFLADPNSPPPYKSEPLKRFLASRHRYNQNGVQACDQLKVDRRLEAAIGASSAAEEVLFNKVWLLAKKEEDLSATVHDIQLGKTTGSAQVTAQIQRSDTIYSVLISGSPLAMPDEKPRLILRLDFDATQPLFSRDHYSEEQAAAKAKDILEILDLF